MKHILFKILTALLFIAITVTAQTVWNGKNDISWYIDDMEATEYTLTTAEELAGLAYIVNDGQNMSGKTIKLGANIVLNNTDGWENWEEEAPENSWIAIGIAHSNSHSFSGTFDGGGHIISGIYINKKENPYRGLFGYNIGTIKNVGVVDFYIKGEDCIGGLVGYNKGTVSNVYSTGNVSGKVEVGVLVGYNEKGIVSNSYSTGTVSGSSGVGGLVGYNYEGIVSNSYSAGKVNGYDYVGGLVGRSDGIVGSSYYDMETSKRTDTGKGEGKTTADMKSKSFPIFLNKNAYTYAEGQYPKLGNKLTGEVNVDSYFKNGVGTEANPYIITTKDELECFSAFVYANENFSGKYFKLGNDIALNDTTGWQNWGSKLPKYSWTAIGYDSNPFSGTFDGAGHIISGIYIKNSNDYQGLFASLGKGGVIKNLGVVASYIRGKSYVGGLVGYNDEGTVSNNYSAVPVSGTSNVGGLVGYNYKGVVSHSYSIGKVVGSEFVGGLVGNGGSGVRNCYYDVKSSGQTDAGKGTPKTTSEMKNPNTYVYWDFTDIWGIDAGINNGYPYLIKEEPEPGESSSSSSDYGNSSSSGGDGKVLCKIGNLELELSKEDCELAGGSTGEDNPSSSSGSEGDSSSSSEVGDGSSSSDGNEPSSSSGEGNTPIISQFTGDKIQIQTIGNAILLSNLPANSKVEVYNLRGERIYASNRVNLSILRIGVQTKGIYIAKVSFGSENKVMRTIIR